MLRAAFARRTARHKWEARLGRAGVPTSMHRTDSEWSTEAHVRDAGLVTPAEGGGVRLAPSAWLGDATSAPPPRPRTTKKTSGSAWLPRHGTEDATQPYCLSGVRVVDMCNVIAGPTIGSMLARLGADVLKIDPPAPAYAPEISVVYGLVVNVGKRSILIDVLTHEGRAVLHAILRDADVLLVNCTRDCLARARLTRADLRRVNPCWYSRASTRGADRAAERAA